MLVLVVYFYRARFMLPVCIMDIPSLNSKSNFVEMRNIFFQTMARSGFRISIAIPIVM